MSRTFASGEQCVDTPPRRSKSASCNDVRSSKRVSPPNMAARKGLSGLRMVFIWERSDGRSLIQWRESEERTASKVLGAKGSCSSASTTLRLIGIWLLKGRLASRFRRVGDVSAQVRWLRREEGGLLAVAVVAVVGAEESVRARAMLQALAPRSRM